MEVSYGAKGQEVKDVQSLLNQVGHGLKVDGQWGDKTEAAVRAFQKSHGLAVDGIVGPKTMAALERSASPAPAAPATAAAATGKTRESQIEALQHQFQSTGSPLAKAIGYAEGNRTKDGAKTADYGGHYDPVNQQRNVGNFSLQHPTATPAEADQMQLAKLRGAVPAYVDACRRNGLDPADPRLAATYFDLFNQSEKAANDKGGFLDQLPKLAKNGLTEENLGKARLESWRDPGTHKLDHGFASDKKLIDDQQRRQRCLMETAGNAAAGPASAPATEAPAGKIGLGSTGPHVKELKQALKDAGFYHGPVNDRMGQQGIDALKEAKTKLGIPGAADVAGAETLRQIREKGAGTHVEVPFVSQFDPQVPGDYPGQSAKLKCDNACEVMMRKAGTEAGRGNGMVTEFHGGGQAERSFQYLEQQLKAGHPVMIGVNHPHGSNTKSNLNGINHYLVATGIGVDRQGHRYIQFHDPAQQDPALGRDTNPENRLYLNERGGFVQVNAGAHANDPYELRGVVRNAD